MTDQVINPIAINEESLHGGNSTEGVVRIGRTVHRPVAVNGEYTHAVLMRLKEAGFTSAPEYLGQDDQDREIVTYFDGDVPHNVKDTKWTNYQLTTVAKLMRGIHDATAETDLAGSEEVVCHNDYAPWNIVFKDGEPYAVIDFDDAAPGSRIRDLSYAIWCWTGLGSDVHTLAEQTAWIQLMCDGYGLEDRSTLLDEIAERQTEIKAKHLKAGRTQNAERVQDDIDWLKVHKDELAKGLVEA